MERIQKLLRFLRAPFPPERVEFKVQAYTQDRKRGMAVAYIDARAVQDRLDEAIEEGLLQDWEAGYTLLKRDLPSPKPSEGEESGEGAYVVECRLTLRLPGGETLVRVDVGEGDTLKAAYSDALKRAAVQFGIGRYLYALPKEWVNLRGREIAPEELERLRRRLREGQPAPQVARRPSEGGPLQEDLRARLRRADERLGELVERAKARGLKGKVAEIMLRTQYSPGQWEGAKEEELRVYLERASRLYRELEALLRTPA